MIIIIQKMLRNPNLRHFDFFNFIVGVKLKQKRSKFPQCKQFQRKTKNILKSFFVLQRFTFEGLKEKFLRF